MCVCVSWGVWGGGAGDGGRDFIIERERERERENEAERPRRQVCTYFILRGDCSGVPTSNIPAASHLTA